MSGLAQLLANGIEELMHRWTEAIRHGIAPGDQTEIELRDHIPLLMRELRRALEGGETPPHSEAAEEHGRQRYRIGFDVEALVREYSVLRTEILDWAAEHGVEVTMHEVRILADFISNAVAEGVIQYNQERLEDERERVAANLQAVQDREARLFSTLDSIGDAVISIDLTGRISFLNRIAEAVTGWTSDEVRGRPHGDVFRIRHEHDRHAIESPVDHVLQHGTAVGAANHVLVRRDGTEIIVDDNAAPIAVEGGTLLGVVLVFRDVSVKRRQENELSMFKALVEASDDYIAVADPHQRVEYMNPAALHLSGFSSLAEATAVRATDTLSEPTRVGVAVAATAETLAGRSWKGEVSIVNRQSGEVVPLEARTIPIRGADGTVERLGTINRDIRARQQADAERRQLFEAAREARDQAQAERQKLERLFTQAPVAIAIHEGPAHTYTFANSAYRRLVGGRDVVGKTLFDALPEMRGQGFDQLFDRVKASGEPFVAEAQPATLLRDGQPQQAWFTFVFAPKCNAAGEIDGIMQCAVEVTPQIEAHQRSEQAMRRQAEFEQQLIGIVSHDLRNPLHVISLSSSLLKQDEGLSQRSLQFVVRIQNASERAVRMVADLLDFTKARLGGGLSLSLRPCDLHQIVRAVLDEVEAAHPDRRLLITYEGDGNGLWDSDRLGQVVQNLVTNALKYSFPDSPVEIVTRGSAREILFSVHNRGTPIPADKIPVLFEPYQRAVAHSVKADRSIGLGLYIVQHIVKAHEGTVQVRSDEEGTTFSVTLPRRTALAAPPPAA